LRSEKKHTRGQGQTTITRKRLVSESKNNKKEKEKTIQRSEYEVNGVGRKGRADRGCTIV
jgi:hypothetical protein